jgi:hypothetical protein
MPIVEFFTSDPGSALLASNTKINIIEELAQALRLTGGLGSVGLYGDVVNDRGLANIPQRLAGPEDLKTLYGGFQGWMGAQGTLGAAANYNDRGSLSGYNGNLAAQVDGLDAPFITLTIPDMAIKDITFGPTAVDLLVSFDRTAPTGPYTLPAGFRISDGAGTPYILATLEEVTWLGTDDTDKTVRVRRVSAPAVAPVALNTVTTLLDTPADATVAVSTVAVTVPFDSDAADLIARYKKAFDESLSYATGTIAEVVVCDRTELAIVDDLFIHASDASAQGHFRLAVGSPPVGTSASVAQGSATDGVGRLTLLQTYGGYLHQGWNRQFSADSANLNAENGYQTIMPSAMSFAFNQAQFLPEENPTQASAEAVANLTAYKVVGVEPISPLPDRKAHEDAGIIQPVIEFANVGGLNASLVPTFHGAPLADGVLKWYTRRMAFYLYRNFLAIAAPYHKKLASLKNRTALLDSMDDFLEQLLENERIGGFNPTTGSWDPGTSQFTVQVAIQELGNMDVLTIRSVFGSDVETSRNLEAA